MCLLFCCYSINQPQIICVLHVLACACTHTFVCYVDTCVIACYTTQSHASAAVTQVFNNAHQSITYCSLHRYQRNEEHVIVTKHTGSFIHI